MPRPTTHSPLLAALGAILLTLALSSCRGGGDGGESLAHIQGSSARITKPMLDHWMRALVGEDFRSSVGTKGPVGLVSEPANYRECAEAAKKIVPRSFTGKLKLSDAQISAKCHLLHRALKDQALAFLISVAWTVREGEEQGLKVTDAELHRRFQQFAKSVYGSPTKQRQYLEERHLSQADILYMLKRNILVGRILPKFKARVQKAGGGERTYTRLALERYHGLIAKTSCKPGYVVQGCREYREPTGALPSAGMILEGFAQKALG